MRFGFRLFSVFASLGRHFAGTFVVVFWGSRRRELSLTLRRVLSVHLSSLDFSVNLQLVSRETPLYLLLLARGEFERYTADRKSVV